jgi:hypothetical protein
MISSNYDMDSRNSKNRKTDKNDKNSKKSKQENDKKLMEQSLLILKKQNATIVEYKNLNSSQMARVALWGFFIFYYLLYLLLFIVMSNVFLFIFFQSYITNNKIK